MPAIEVKDLLEMGDGDVTWNDLRVRVSRAPKTCASTAGKHGDWIRATLDIEDGTGKSQVVWTEPVSPYLDNPSLLTGKHLVIAKGAKLEIYKGERRIRAKGPEIAVLEDVLSAPQSAVPVAPAPTSHAPAPSQAPSPGAAHPLMGPDRAQITDRALLQAYAAWGPQLWAILDPGMQAAPGTAQAVAAAMNTMTIAAGQGKLVITMFAEPGE